MCRRAFTAYQEKMILWNTEQGKIFTYPLPHSLQKATLQKTGSFWTEGPLVNGPWNIISHWNAVLKSSQWHLLLKCLCQYQFQWVLPLYQNNYKTNIEHCWGFCNKGFGQHRFLVSIFFNYYLKRQTALWYYDSKQFHPDSKQRQKSNSWKNLKIIAQWWTLSESHLSRLYLGIFNLQWSKDYYASIRSQTLFCTKMQFWQS